jgi:hypothetical protein
MASSGFSEDENMLEVAEFRLLLHGNGPLLITVGIASPVSSFGLPNRRRIGLAMHCSGCL